MGIGLREHVISLVAVFVALCVGILIGVSLSRQETLESKMNKLSQQFSTLSEENRSLRQSVELLENLQRARADFDLPFLEQSVAHRLDGIAVALVWWSDLKEVAFEADLQTTLATAGANLTASLSVSPDFRQLVDRVDLSRATSQQWAPQDRPREVARQMGMLAAAGRWAELQRFADLRLCALSGPRERQPQALVLIGQAAPPQSATEAEQPAPDPAEMPLALLEGAKQVGLYLLAAETVRAPLSEIDSLRRVAAATVDNVETIPGQVALVQAISRRATGDFGVKRTAQSLLPPSG